MTKTGKQLTVQTTEALTPTSQEDKSETMEMDKLPESEEEVLAKTPAEVDTVTEDKQKGMKEAEDMREKIKNRLESLAKMYASSKVDHPEDEFEEEEG
jgi:hypothetical protein